MSAHVALGTTARTTARTGVRTGTAMTMLLLAFSIANAQPAAPRAITGTVGDLLRAATTSARVAQFEDTMPVEHATLTRQLDALGRRALDSLSLDAVGREWMATEGPRTAPLERIARWRRNDVLALMTPAEAVALDSLAMVSSQYLPDLLELRVSVDSANTLFAPVRAFNRARRQVSLSQSLEKLRRYERKYGPGSPRLNAAEIGLNFVAQNVPPFQPSADGWPSPLELVASYVPTYLTVHDGRAQAWTVLEGGVRLYMFDPAWGQPGMAGVIRPSHISAGLAVVNEVGGALREPWRGDSRLGAFLSWGDAKIAFVGGDGPNVLIHVRFSSFPGCSNDYLPLQRHHPVFKRILAAATRADIVGAFKKLQRGLHFRLATDVERCALVQVRRVDVENATRAVDRETTRLLGNERERIRLVQQAQLATR